MNPHPPDVIRVFVENEAGLAVKNHFDEKVIEWLRSEKVSRPYPYPYGFILETTSGDGDNLDCFVLTSTQLRSGTIVACRPVGLLEQTEAGLRDHNVLAVPVGEQFAIPIDTVRQTLTDFMLHVFRGQPSRQIEVGQLLGEVAAREEISRCRDLIRQG